VDLMVYSFEHVNEFATASNVVVVMTRTDQGKQFLRILLFGVDHHLRSEAIKDVVTIWAVGRKESFRHDVDGRGGGGRSHGILY